MAKKSRVFTHAGLQGVGDGSQRMENAKSRKWKEQIFSFCTVIYLPWQRLVFKSLMDTSFARILVTHHRFIEAFEWVPAQDTHKSDQIPPLLLLFVKILLDYSIIHSNWGGE